MKKTIAAILMTLSCWSVAEGFAGLVPFDGTFNASENSMGVSGSLADNIWGRAVAAGATVGFEEGMESLEFSGWSCEHMTNEAPGMVKWAAFMMKYYNIVDGYKVCSRPII